MEWGACETRRGDCCWSLKDENGEEAAVIMVHAEGYLWSVRGHRAGMTLSFNEAKARVAAILNRERPDV